jgi:hypothetical protein
MPVNTPGEDLHGPPREAVRDHAADQQRRDQRERPAGHHDADLGRAAADLEHGERQRDPDHPVAQPGDRLREEQLPELAQAEHTHHRSGYVRPPFAGCSARPAARVR